MHLAVPDTSFIEDVCAHSHTYHCICRSGHLLHRVHWTCQSRLDHIPQHSLAGCAGYPLHGHRNRHNQLPLQQTFPKREKKIRENLRWRHLFNCMAKMVKREILQGNKDRTSSCLEGNSRLPMTYL